jgi:hypothetical protein
VRFVKAALDKASGQLIAEQSHTAKA